MGTILRALLPRKFEYVLFKVDSLEPPADPDFTVEEIGSGREPTAEQRAFVLRHVSAVGFWYQMRWVRRGEGWLFIVRCDGRPAFYMFVTPAARRARVFPVITEEKALLLGPGLTDPEFRGRRIHPRVIRYATAVLSERGWGPFYASTSTTNEAAIRGITRSGLQRVGVWAGARLFFDLFVRTRKVSD